MPMWFNGNGSLEKWEILRCWFYADINPWILGKSPWFYWSEVGYMKFRWWMECRSKSTSQWLTDSTKPFCGCCSTGEWLIGIDVLSIWKYLHTDSWSIKWVPLWEGVRMPSKLSPGSVICQGDSQDSACSCAHGKDLLQWKETEQDQ